MWKTRISDKFRNTRQRKDKNVPAVIENKRKEFTAINENLEDTDEHLKKKRISKSWCPAASAPNFFGKSRPSTEDVESIAAHVKYMCQEYKKSHPDMIKVNNLMRLTFYDRRQYILSNVVPLKDIQEKYPFMFDVIQVNLI